jgi:hypothetical protein
MIFDIIAHFIDEWISTKELRVLRFSIPAMISIAVGALAWFGIYQLPISETRVLNEGVRAGGVVTEKHSFSDSEGSSYSIGYFFTLPDGSWFNDWHNMEFQTWNDLSPGSKIEIAFDSQNPAKNLPVTGADTVDEYLPIIAFISAFFAGVASFIASFLLIKRLLMLSQRRTDYVQDKWTSASESFQIKAKPPKK